MGVGLNFPDDGHDGRVNDFSVLVVCMHGHCERMWELYVLYMGSGAKRKKGCILID